MKKTVSVCSYVLEFTVCAFCGWIYEVLLEFAVYHRYSDRGVLHLPVCPIYGFGGLALLMLFRRRNGWQFVFIISTVMTTVLEFGASYLLEHFGYRLWDYSDWPFDFEGRVSLLSSLIFGMLAVGLIKGVHPLMGHFREAVPAWIVCVSGIGCGLVLLADSIRVFFFP